METFLAKTKAAMDAASGTDFLNIARTEAKLKYGLDEAIERCRRALELGAEMTLIIGLLNMEEAERVAKYVPGWKMWPDVAVNKDGKADVELDDIAPLGFNFVTAHMLDKHAVLGMYDFAKHNIANKNTLYNDLHTMGHKPEDVKLGAFGAEAKNAPKRRDLADFWNEKGKLFWDLG